MTSGYSLILIGVVTNALAQLMLKAGTNAVGHFEFTAQNLGPVGLRLALSPWILGGVLAYAVSLVVWIMALSRIEVSIAYPMVSLGYILNAVAAWYFFGEGLGPMRLAGIGFIVFGVLLIARS